MMRNECDKLIDYFNDQLETQEKKEYEEHLESCADCKEELHELQLLTNDLPFASEPVDPPEDMKDRVLGSVFAEESPASNDSQIEHESENREEQSSVVDLKRQRNHSLKKEKTWRTKQSWALRGLVAALLLSIGGNLFALVNEQEQAVEEPEPENPPAEDSSTDQVAKSVQLKGEATQANATASVIQQKNGSLLTLQAKQLDKLEGEQVYQVWLIKGKTPHRAGTFVANNNGDGAVAYSMDQLPEDTKWDAVAISKEPDATSQTPQGEVILSSEL